LVLNEQVDGVWHTGVVVFGKEYYFGGDIYFDEPAKTGFGNPRQQIVLGTTLRQRDELHSYIVSELKREFTRDLYDAARNNCNHFSDRIAMFLVGKHIPEDVLTQPMLMMKTGIGRALRPIVSRYLGTCFEPQTTTAAFVGDKDLSECATFDDLPKLIKLGEGNADTPLWGDMISL